MRVSEKKTYTEETLSELRCWFEGQTLPESMQIDVGIYTPHLRDTVNALMEEVVTYHENPRTMSCILLLERIKENLLSQHNDG